MEHLFGCVKMSLSMSITEGKPNMFTENLKCESRLSAYFLETFEK